MKFKGNIYITDPSYIALIEDWADGEGFDPTDEVIRCLPFTNYLFKSTGLGDGSWNVYELDPLSKHSFVDIHKIIEQWDYYKYKVIGTYCVDSATACVMYQQEADKYNPAFRENFNGKPHCWTLLEDFEGEIETYYDSEGELHFIGIGNRCFFSA